MTHKLTFFFLYVHFLISLYYFYWTSSLFLHAFISFFIFRCICNFSFSFLAFGVSFLVYFYYFPSNFFSIFICVNVCLFFSLSLSLSLSLFIFVFFTFLPFALFLCFSSFLSLRFVYFWTSILLLLVAVSLLTPSIASLSVLQVHVS